MYNSFLKSIILTFIFLSSLFASNEEVNQKLFELKTSQEYAQKINDEKITLIMGQIILKENEIKELEKQLKEYVNKEDLQREINYQNNRIEDINSHVDKLSISVTVVGILITVILLLFTGTFFYVSNKKHLEKIDEWIAKNKDKILEPIHEEGNNLLRNIEEKALKFYQEQLKDLKLDEKLNESQKQVELEILNKVNELLEHKSKEEYTFDDWYSKYISSFYKNDFKNALIYINNALQLAIGNKQVSTGLFNKALVYSKKADFEKAIEIYTKLIDKFKESQDNSILVNVASALLNKGVALGKLKNSEKEIEVYEEVVKRFEGSKENSILEQVAKSLYNKGVTLGQLNRSEEAIEVYEEVVKRFEDSKESSILNQVAKALVNKIETNLILNNPNSHEDLKLCLKLIEGDINKLILYKILTLLEKAKNSNIDNEIEEWKEEFKDTTIENWSFSELKDWANSFENKEVKERLLKYIDIFENHNKK